MAYFIKDEHGQPLKHGSGTVFMAVNEGVVKGVDMNLRTLHMTGTAEVKDRDGDIVVTSGVDLTNYLKNPVFLWSHTYSGPASVPLGKTTRILKKKSPNRIDFVIQFSSMGLNPFADMVLALYNEGIINASSIGFIPHEWEKIEEDEDKGDMLFWRGRKFTKLELLELSGCAVPSNPAALQNAIKGYAHPQTTENDRKSIYEILMGVKVLDLKTAGVDELELMGELQEMKTEVEEVDETKTSVQVPEDVTPKEESEKDASQGVDNTDKNEYNMKDAEGIEKTEEATMPEEKETTEEIEKIDATTDKKPNEASKVVEDFIAWVTGQGEVVTVSAEEFVKHLLSKHPVIEPQKETSTETSDVPEEKSEESKASVPELTEEEMIKLTKSLQSVVETLKGVK